MPRDYRFVEHEQTSETGIPGLRIFKKHAKVRAEKPAWNQRHTVLRPFPGRDPDNPAAFDAFKLSDTKRDFGDWIRSVLVARVGTSPGFTFPVCDPRDPMIDKHQTPAWVLYNAINNAVRADAARYASWLPLVVKVPGATSDPPITKPKPLGLVQGFLIVRQSKVLQPPMGLDPSGDTVVLMLTEAATNTLCEKADEAPQDLVHPAAGMYINIYQEGSPALFNSGGVQTATPQQGWGASQAGGGGGQQQGFVGYSVDLLPLFNGMPAAITDPAILSLVKPWDDIIDFPTIEEQVRMIATSGLPSDAVAYALGERFGEYLPRQVASQQPATRPQAQGWGQPQQGAQQGPPPYTAPSQQPPTQPAPPTTPNEAPTVHVPPQQPQAAAGWGVMTAPQNGGASVADTAGLQSVMDNAGPPAQPATMPAQPPTNGAPYANPERAAAVQEALKFAKGNMPKA
jgi:hypothetical protein